uniref:BTB domain-containing protein n=1 Tax=Ananas comosus var. bracteatus TaxID=296719 RepID=A0A6V7QWY9_ANACO
MANYPTQLGVAPAHPMEEFVFHVGGRTLLLSATAMIYALSVSGDPPQVSPCHVVLLFLLCALGIGLIHVSPALRRVPRAVAVARALHRLLWEPRQSQGNRVKKWECTDAGIQSHVLKTMAAFISCLSSAPSQHPLIKDSISDMLVALEGILQSENERILSQAVDATQKLVSTIGNSVRQDGQRCESQGIWEALEKTKTIRSIADALRKFVGGVQPIECFTAMTALLTTILWKWPSARYHVWSNNMLMVKVERFCGNPDSSIAISVLKLYSALALCGHGVMKLLERKELTAKVVQSLGKSHPISVRIEALKLCRHLMRSAKGCSMLTSLNCEAIVQEINRALGGWRSSSCKRIPQDQIPLVIEACRTALMTRWVGPHHSFFWANKIDKILLDILIGNCITKNQTQVLLSSENLLSLVSDNITSAQPFIWDILGYLAAHCEEDFHPKSEGKPLFLDILISCACLVATDMMQKGITSLPSSVSEIEPVSRAVLLMFVLSSLKVLATGDVSIVSNSLHSITNLINLASFSTLPEYHNLISENNGVEILSNIIKSCLKSDIRVSRSSIASHLQCCWHDVEEWEGDDIILFYSLRALSQLIGFSNLVYDHTKESSNKHSEAQELISNLQYILSSTFGRGPRWFAAYILSFFGLYGFANKLGRRMEKALYEQELADVELVLMNGQSYTVHGAILAARCPYLLPQRESHIEERKLDGHHNDLEIGHHREKLIHRVRMSDRVDSDALFRILEYVYTGFTLVDKHLIKQLKVLSKFCELKHLSALLQKKQLSWGMQVPALISL